MGLESAVVWCFQVFQRRMSGKTDFYRTWSEYSGGFGNLSEEFWLGTVGRNNYYPIIKY